MDDPNNKTDAESSDQREWPGLEDGEQELFVHYVELRPDASGRKRPTLMVGVMPRPR